MPLDVLLGFVDRESELTLFHSMLSGETDKRVLLVMEQGEEGKTCFLLKLTDECESQSPPVPVVLLDFDRRRSGLTDFLSVAREVRRCLGDDCTPALCACEDAIYHRGPLVSVQPGAGDGGVDFGRSGNFAGAEVANVAGRDFYQVSESQAPPTADQIARQKAEMGRALCSDLAGLVNTHRRAVLLVDTFEHAPDDTCAWLEQWLFEPLRSELSHILLAVAGRPECRSFFERQRRWGSLVNAIDGFTPFSDTDIHKHYEQRGILVGEKERSLLQMARTSPARMALLGDWLEQTRGGAR